MRKIIFMLICLVFGLSMKAQTSYVPDEFVFYDARSGEPFIYDGTLNTGQEIASFHCGIAYDVTYSGNHLHFSITNEDFKWHIIRRTTDDYVDFIVNLNMRPFNPTTDYWPAVSQYVIRVNFRN